MKNSLWYCLTFRPSNVPFPAISVLSSNLFLIKTVKHTFFYFGSSSPRSPVPRSLPSFSLLSSPHLSSRIRADDSRLANKLDCINQPSVVIDLVGAAGYEFDAFMKWEEILNFCPTIEDLTVLSKLHMTSFPRRPGGQYPCSLFFECVPHKRGSEMTGSN